jgi:hypothetical protein
MELQTIVNLVAGGAFTVGGWFARQIWDAVAELRKDLHSIEVELPQIYLRKDEFREGLKEVKDILNEIFRKIDDINKAKADK